MNQQGILINLKNIAALILQGKIEHAVIKWGDVYPAYSIFECPELYIEEIEDLYNVIDSIIRFRHHSSTPYSKEDLKYALSRIDSKNHLL